MAKIIVSDANGEREVALDRDEISIGRTAQNDVAIKVAEASRQHCRVVREGKAWFVEDLGSSNGTRVNGRRVTKFELQDGDEIQIGAATMRFLESDLAGPVVSAPMGGDDDEIELEISLDDDAWIRFLNTDRAGEKVELGGRITIGRKSTNTVSLKEHGVSGTHAEIDNRGGEWFVRDLGSTNGIIVDGAKVKEAPLGAGTSLRIGSVHFVVGVAGSEGDGSLIDTLVTEEVDLDDEIFAISEKNMQRRQKAALALWGVVLVAAGAGLFYWFSQTGTKADGTRAVERVSGNLVIAGASFEVDEDLGDYLSTESDAIDYEETDRRAHSGASSLEVSARGAGTHDLRFEEPLPALGGSDQLRIGGWVRNSGLDGFGGFSLLWLDGRGRAMGHSRLNAPAGLGAFTEVSGLYRVPNGARSARLAVSVTDGSGRLQVDDVFAVKVPREERQALTVQGFEAILEPNGLATITRDALEVVADLGLHSRSSGSLSSWQDVFVPGELRREAGVHALDGTIGTEERAVSAEVRALGDGFGFAVSGGGDGDVLAFQIPADDDVVSVAREGGTQRHVDAFRREGVTTLVVGSGVRAAEIDLGEPGAVELLSVGGRSWLVLPLVEGRREIRIRIDFSGGNEEAQAAVQAAERADLVDRKQGLAITLYEDVVNRFPFRKDLVARAEARLRELRRDGEDSIASLAKRADDIVFFKRFVYDYDAFSADASALVSRYEGSEVAREAQALVDRVGAAWAESREEDRLETARNHLARGQDLMQPGDALPVVARGFFRSVIALAPETELATTARAELDRIKTLIGSSEGN
ncbi:MAG: FHA domain-containing protein [Planctomycetota bacterium]